MPRKTGKSSRTDPQNRKSGQRPTTRRSTGGPDPIRPASRVILYGRNSVRAALANKKRIIEEAHGLSSIFGELGGLPADLKTSVIPTDSSDIIAHLADRDVPHQNCALVTRRLPDVSLEDCIPSDTASPARFLVLDSVVDPQNVGAAMRVAAALGLTGLITQDRNAPEESGALARASAGTLEILPWIRVANLSRALDTLKDTGFWIAGLDGRATESVGKADLGARFALVMGSEGKGMRPNVARHCDMLLKIPMAEGVESLNVSVAAGIALYALSKA